MTKAKQTNPEPEKVEEVTKPTPEEKTKNPDIVASTRVVVGSDGKKYLKSYNKNGDVILCELAEESAE